MYRFSCTSDTLRQEASYRLLWKISIRCERFGVVLGCPASHGESDGIGWLFIDQIHSFPKTSNLPLVQNVVPDVGNKTFIATVNKRMQTSWFHYQIHNYPAILWEIAILLATRYRVSRHLVPVCSCNRQLHWTTQSLYGIVQSSAIKFWMA